MSGKNQDQAALKSHPVAAADATGLTGVYRVAITGAAQSIVLPAAVAPSAAAQVGVASKFVSLRVVPSSPTGTTDIQYAFSKAAQTLVRNQVSTTASPSAAAGATLSAGEVADGRIPATMAYLNIFGSAADGYIEYYVSETRS